MRHGAGFREPVVRGYAVTHPPGSATLPSAPGWNQLVHTNAGSMRVTTAEGSWTIPPHRALWIRGARPVTVTNRSAVSVRNVYLADTLPALAPETAALRVPRFAGELLRHVVGVCPLDGDRALDQALVTVLVDQLRSLPPADLWLPYPADVRAVAFAAAAYAEPATPSAVLAHGHGTSVRTLERVFAAQTGVSLGAWRRRARILGSLEGLAAGLTVTVVAAGAGYSTASAYVTAFRRELGQTPRAFLAR